jgi:hypothetical protein
MRDLTLASWAASVWERELRGVPLEIHEAALAYCMKQHNEWKPFWNQLASSSCDHAKVVSILVHIYNDAAVKLQVDRNEPPEINSSFQTLRGKGVTDMDALHRIAFVLQEQTWSAKTSGGAFDMKLYLEKVQSAVQFYIEHRGDQPRMPEQASLF